MFWPQFDVTVITIGQRWGLLLAKQKAEGEPTYSEYFYLTGDFALALTKGISPAVRFPCHAVKRTKTNCRLMREWCAQAKAAAASKHRHQARPLTEDYPKGGYSKDVYHLFERDADELIRFLEHKRNCYQALFRFDTEHSTLCDVTRRCRVVTLDQFELYGNPRYLQPAEDILKWEYKGQGCWFRKGGPLAVDFKSGCYYSRLREQSELKHLVRANRVSALLGAPATGKTALTRHLAFTLRSEQDDPVSFVSWDSNSGFNTLVDEIKYLDGLTILDDAHLHLRDARDLIERLQYSTGGVRLLLVSRYVSPIRNGRWSPHPILGDIPYMALNKPPDILSATPDDLKSDGLSDSAADRIVHQHAGNNFWRILYSLRGRELRTGNADLRSLIREGVQSDLNTLKESNTRYPEALVAIAAFSRFEIPVHESYLRDVLSIDVDVLNALLSDGEIVREEDHDRGDVFYRLPHPSLAKLYCSHGKLYTSVWGSPPASEHIFKYMRCHVPNRLRTVAATPPVLRRILLIKLPCRMVRQLVQEESSLSALASLVEYPLISPLRGRKVLRRIGRMLCSGNDVVGAASLLAVMRIWDKPNAYRLCDYIPTSQLASLIMRSDYLSGLSDLLCAVAWINGTVAERECEFVDAETLAMQLSNTHPLAHVAAYVTFIHDHDGSKGQRLCSSLQEDVLAERITECRSIESIRGLLSSLFYADRSKCEKLLMLIKNDKLEAMFQDCRDPLVFVDNYVIIKKLVPARARHIWDAMGIQRWAETLPAAGYEWSLCDFLDMGINDLTPDEAHQIKTHLRIPHVMASLKAAGIDRIDIETRIDRLRKETASTPK